MSDQKCGNCKFFAKGKGGAGYRAMVTAMILGNGRYFPRTSEVATVVAMDKDGQCTFNPEGVAKHKSESCGQWKPAEPSP